MAALLARQTWLLALLGCTSGSARRADVSHATPTAVAPGAARESCGDTHASSNDCGACGHQCGERQTCMESRCIEHAGLTVAGAHACAIFTEGTVACWGQNDRGQLGLGTVSTSEPPTRVPGLNDVVELTSGDSFTCARKADDTLWCWGANRYGQLGDGTLVDRATARQILGLPKVTHVASSRDEVCALDRSDVMWCWGYDTSAPFESNRLDRTRPVKIALPLKPIGIAVGAHGACAWSADGQIACQGERPFLFRGKQALEKVPEAALVQSVPGTVGMGFGPDVACAIRNDGALFCWGFRVTTPPSLTFDETAVEVTAVSDVAEIAGGWGYMLARLRTGGLVTWGSLHAPGLAPAPDATTHGPRAVATLTGVAQIALGGFFCARLIDGKIVCSGHNDNGRLGDGTIDHKTDFIRTVLAPDSMNHADWQSLLADGEGDPCRTQSDCDWVDDCAASRCRARSFRETATCDAPRVSAGECTCTGGRCMLRPSKPPAPPDGNCSDVECGLDQAEGRCLLGRGIRGNSHRNLDGPSCHCDPSTARCQFVWREPVPCHQDADCWFITDPVRRPAPRPAALRKHRFAPCVDGDAAPVCTLGQCSFGPTHGC
jgi:alpha-tubulin suppressor-like RCC1 family protein